jgi:predicted XRE-type DNA-binding protein
MSEDTSIRRGGKNIFADLEFPDPETHLLKAELVTKIRRIINDRSLKQTEAAAQMGLSQPDVSRLLRGQFRDISVDRLMRMLNRLGCDVDIVIHEHKEDDDDCETIHLPACCA